MIAGTLFVFLCTIFLIWYIKFHIRRGRMYKLAAQYNGPRSLPILGNILQTFVPLTEISDHILESCLLYKSPSRLWIGPQLSVCIWDPENVKIVLNSPFALAKEPYLYKLSQITDGRGLISLPVDEWRRHRKLIAPVFNQKFLEVFFDVFSRLSVKVVMNVRDKVDKGIFDAHDYFATYAIHSVMDTLMGFTEESRDLSSIHDFSQWYQSILVTATTRMTNSWYVPDFIFNMSSLGKKFNEDKLRFDGFISALTQKWEKHSANMRAATNKPNRETGSFKPMTLMDHLASTSDGSGKFTTEELHGEINNLISAGFDTTSTVSGFALMLLGIHPEIQDKVFNEISEAVGNKEQLEYTDLRNLEYLERVIKETLRLFPTLIALGRYTEQEIQLTDHVIPANTSVLIIQMGLHRDPSIWPNPSKFDPDRFLPEEESKRHPFSWIPFSAGPRNCIGMKFAYISIKTVLSTFLLNYKVATDYKSVEDIKLTAMAVFKPTNGHRISITRRDDTTN